MSRNIGLAGYCWFRGRSGWIWTRPRESTKNAYDKCCRRKSMISLKNVSTFISAQVTPWNLLRAKTGKHSDIINPANTTAYKYIKNVDRKYSESVQLPAKAKFGGFCRQHMATLATPTIGSIKCKQSPVYGVFWPLLPHPSTDRNETRTWSSLSPRNLPVKFGTNPSTFFLVIVVTDRQTHTQTHAQTNAGKTYSLAFAGRTNELSKSNKTLVSLALLQYFVCQTNTQRCAFSLAWKTV